jgi:hypothetical protein
MICLVLENLISFEIYSRMLPAGKMRSIDSVQQHRSMIP